MNQYPKRLIEVDLPIKRISAHARREKSIRHGHISTLHIWWARRPLAACRAVICASLWFDPADEKCPESFREAARAEMRKWGRDHRKLMSAESLQRFEVANKDPKKYDDDENLRYLLLGFIADFANWDNSTNEAYLETSRRLTEVAHIANGGEPGTRPLVADPFAGGGAIPLEALRVGADAFASDLNPVAVLLNKVVLEYIPKYGQRLADEVRKWGAWVKQEAEKELAEFYPKDPYGSTPIAYLWARTVTCEGPGCGAEVPLIRSLWLAKKGKRGIALQLVPDRERKEIALKIITRKNGRWANQEDEDETVSSPSFDGTCKSASATCPCCGFTTPSTSVREQLKRRQGGAHDARLLCVVSVSTNQSGRLYRLPTESEFAAIRKATESLETSIRSAGMRSLVPDEELDIRAIRLNWCILYGITEFSRMFSPRQKLALTTYSRMVHDLPLSGEVKDPHLRKAIVFSLALIVDKLIQYNSSLCRWKPTGENLVDTFGRQALPMVWDFAEANPTGGASGDWKAQLDWYLDAVTKTSEIFKLSGVSQIESASATRHPLPDDSAQGLITDPPYYDAIPYAYLSDYFYVWLKRTIPRSLHNSFLDMRVTPKDEEIVVDRPHALSNSHKTLEFYESELTKAFDEGRRVTAPNGIGLVVFASKTTSSWESVLQALLSANWVITGSWPIDTEMATKVAAIGQARLMSSVHIVCRPRENAHGDLTTEIGDWRDVLRELPVRIHEWMPRLANEGVVGADAIFACLGPALEIFSRYSSVEKPSGEVVKLREYLEHVWEAVAKEALSMVFTGADASGFEEDARLTAMWLWTLFSGSSPTTEDTEGTEQEEDENEAESSGKKAKTSGYVLEYDAARRIAQGLGAHLEDLDSIVEVKGDKARLLPVGERARDLFGYEGSSANEGKKKKKSKAQAKLFTEMEDDEYETVFGIGGAPTSGETTLDRVHQTMLLFGAGRSEAVKRFLVDDGVGNDERFWRLANALSALYPTGSEEKRWVDGVLARKKGLGF